LVACNEIKFTLELRNQFVKRGDLLRLGQVPERLFKQYVWQVGVAVETTVSDYFFH